MVSVLHFLFSIDQQKTFLSSSVFNRYGRNTNHKSFPCPFFLKNLRGIVRKAEVRKSTNSVVTESSSRVTKRAVRQRFYPKLQNRLFFLLLPLTTEAMGTGGLRAYSLSHSDKVNAGAKTAKCTSASL